MKIVDLHGPKELIPTSTNYFNCFGHHCGSHNIGACCTIRIPLDPFWMQIGPSGPVAPSAPCITIRLSSISTSTRWLLSLQVRLHKLPSQIPALTPTHPQGPKSPQGPKGTQCPKGLWAQILVPAGPRHNFGANMGPCPHASPLHTWLGQHSIPGQAHTTIMQVS